MIMKGVFRFVLLLLAAAAVAAQTETSTREVLSLDQGWRFNLGDIPMPVIKTHDESYGNAKAGSARRAANPNYDATGWRELDLPHDWAVEGPFKQDENISQGYRPRGIGWYRRQFKVEAADRGKHLELQFDGVATHCTVSAAP
jgi:beta-galactosidase